MEEQIRSALRRVGGRAVTPDDPGYPAGLRSLPGALPTVYLRGTWDHIGPTVAIVGSRSANEDGCDLAKDLAATLARGGIAIVSGLASGIDQAAHRGALDAGGSSGAVLGTSLDRCYPAEHRPLQESLARSLGLMSELPPGARAAPSTFASRNRILAAIADAVVVIQGREDSGSLLTAEAARRIGRPVGAIPWDSREPQGAAPHALIRSGSAKLVRHAADVLELLGDLAAGVRLEADDRSQGDGPTRGRPRSRVPLDERESKLLSALRDFAQPLDHAAARAGLSVSEAGASLVLLELHGYARRETGGMVRRRRGA